ncbi:hypothetical protein, partial [uncultured Phocaeicola sp.]|uniref:hypothetical protein n=1 Tax=uncultured Phocaeicola sp. TaxID=990718 RepID=UPI002635D2F8
VTIFIVEKREVYNAFCLPPSCKDSHGHPFCIMPLSGKPLPAGKTNKTFRGDKGETITVYR